MLLHDLVQGDVKKKKKKKKKKIVRKITVYVKNYVGIIFYLPIGLVSPYDVSNLLTLQAKRQNFTNMDILYYIHGNIDFMLINIY